MTSLIANHKLCFLFAKYECHPQQTKWTHAAQINNKSTICLHTNSHIACILQKGAGHSFWISANVHHVNAATVGKSVVFIQFRGQFWKVMFKKTIKTLLVYTWKVALKILMLNLIFMQCRFSKSKLISKLGMQKWKPWGLLTNWLANASLLHSHAS